jgi:hypothetical protein
MMTLLVLFATGCDTAGFTRAYLALDSAGNRKRERFFTDTESIFCVGEMASGVDDVTVTATLRASKLYDPRDGRPYDVNYVVGIGEEAPGKGEDITVSFGLEKPDDATPYAAGQFECELAIDGEVKERLPFEIVFPSCPQAPIRGGEICAGFVLDGAQCEGAEGDPCRCTEEGSWSCD